MQKGASLAQLKQTAKDLGISDIVVQWGDKRELQHRANWHNNVEASLRAAEKDPSSGITREHRFYGALEGAIDIYRVGG